MYITGPPGDFQFFLFPKNAILDPFIHVDAWWKFQRSVSIVLGELRPNNDQYRFHD